MTAYVSVFDLFSIGIGPSSSHTVGPMRAARDFTLRLRDQDLLGGATSVTCSLYGSLGFTGIGHGTPDAIVAGLTGLTPEECAPDQVREAWASETIMLAGDHPLAFEKDDVSFEPRTRLPGHANALTLRAFGDTDPLPILEETYYSIGGGFIRREGDTPRQFSSAGHPMPFDSSQALLELCDTHGVSIYDVASANEAALHGEDALNTRLDEIWAAMAACVEAGLYADGILPGGLEVVRRAATVRSRLETLGNAADRDTSTEWLHAFALAVNEENASGGRVVTAPTNGAAGIIPAVGHYYLKFVSETSASGIRKYLLTANAIGSLFKSNASISGTEGGCQAEVGSACSMAAAGLCAVLGGDPHQVENAAEIAMEHHIVSLDTVIETMRQTGIDMSRKYKETSEGGLAVNVIEC